MTARLLSPLTFFFLDPLPREAARLLTSAHITSQGRALGIAWTQIARELGVDLSNHPREKGAYPDRPLTLAGNWALATRANWTWFQDYTTWIFAEDCKRRERRTGKRTEHKSRDYTAWCRRQLEGLGPVDGDLTTPPVPGFNPVLPLDVREAARFCLANYGPTAGEPEMDDGPDLSTDEQLLVALSKAVAGDPGRWDAGRLSWLVSSPHRAISLMSGHPVVIALSAAMSAGIPTHAIARHLGVQLRRSA